MMADGEEKNDAADSNREVPVFLNLLAGCVINTQNHHLRGTVTVQRLRLPHGGPTLFDEGANPQAQEFLGASELLCILRVEVDPSLDYAIVNDTHVLGSLVAVALVVTGIRPADRTRARKLFRLALLARRLSSRLAWWQIRACS